MHGPTIIPDYFCLFVWARLGSLKGGGDNCCMHKPSRCQLNRYEDVVYAFVAKVYFKKVSILVLLRKVGILMCLVKNAKFRGRVITCNGEVVWPQFP